MTALAADTQVAYKPDSEIVAYPVADNVTIWKGSLVEINASGYAIPATDTAGNIFVGVAKARADNTVTGHTAGDILVQVQGGRPLLTGTSFNQASVGASVYVVDSATIGLAAASTNLVRVGTVTRYVSSTQVEVSVPSPGANSRQSNTGVQGAATGYRLARGVSAVTGTATVVTGLATVVSIVATAQDDLDGTALGGVSATIGDQAGAPAAGSVTLKAWKATSSSVTTMIAATAAKSLNWAAVGT